MATRNTKIIHGTAIAWGNRGALIIGPSGSGKSRLALTLMALGCDLVADDQCEVREENNQLIAHCPAAIKGQIEARYFGILTAQSVEAAALACVVDLETKETKRLPEMHTTDILGVKLPLFHNPGIEALPFALIQYLKMKT